MVTEIWVNIGLGNGLLPYGTKPLPEPMLTDHQWSPSDIHIRAISQEMSQPSLTKIHLKITYLYFRSDFSEANELRDGCHASLADTSNTTYTLSLGVNGILISL